MTPESIGLWAASIVATAVVTLWAARYYSRKQSQRQLVAYLDFSSSPFENLDPEVHSSLSLAYEGTKVENLHHVEFVIVNAGHNAMVEYDEPLRLDLPSDMAVVDASVIDAAAGVTADVKTVFDSRRPGTVSLQFSFGLLNPGDWFRAKVLLDSPGKIEPMKWPFSIRAENHSATVSVRSGHLQGKGVRVWTENMFFVTWAAAATALYWGIRALTGFDFLAEPRNALGWTILVVVVVIGLIAAAVVTGWFIDVQRAGLIPEDARRS